MIEQAQPALPGTLPAASPFDAPVPPADAPAEAPTYPPRLARWLVVLLLTVLYTVSLLDRNLLSLLASTIQADLKLTEIQMGALMGMAFALFYAVASLPLGWALDRYNRRMVMWFGITVWSLGTISCGLVRNFWGLFAARSVVGTGEAVLAPGSQVILPELFPPNELALPMSVYATSAKIGAGAALAIGGGLAAIIDASAAYRIPVLGELHGWELIFIMAGAPGLLLAFAVFLIPAQRRPEGAAALPTSYRDYFRFFFANWRFFVPHHLGTLPLSIANAGLMAWLPSFYSRIHHLSLTETGVRLGFAISFATVMALPIHGFVADRLFRRGVHDVHLRYVAIAIVASLPVLVAALLVPSANLSLVLVGVYYSIACTYLSLPGVAMQIVLPAHFRGKAASVMMTISGLVILTTGPLVVAFITQLLGGGQMIGYSMILLAAIGFPLSAVILWCALKPLRTMLQARGH